MATKYRDLKEYIGQKLYIQLDNSTVTEPTDPVTVQGDILLSLDEVLEVAEPDDQFIEITITKTFATLDKCVHIVSIENGVVTERIPTAKTK